MRRLKATRCGLKFNGRLKVIANETYTHYISEDDRPNGFSLPPFSLMFFWVLSD